MSSIFTPELTAALVAHNRLYDVKEFAKAADALLAEGLALLRAHAGEGDVINRYVATVEKVRAQYRAAKEAPATASDVYDGPVTDGMRFQYKDSVFVPDGRRGKHGEFLSAQGDGLSEPNLRGMYRPAPAPDRAPPVFRIVGRSGPGVAVPRVGWIVVARLSDGTPTDRDEPRTVDSGYDISERLWKLGCYDILEPIPAPAPEPSAPPAGVPVCKAWCGTYDPLDMSGAMDGDRRYSSDACRVAGRCLNPPPSDPVPVATGGVPTGYRLGAGWTIRKNGDFWCSHDGRTCGGVGPFKHYETNRGACAAHAVLMGALVPIDTARPGPLANFMEFERLKILEAARPVPPGPVHPATGTTCTRCGQAIQSVLPAFPPVATVDGWRHERCPEVPPGPVPVEVDRQGNPRVYPCADCGTMRSLPEGGTTFTVCDECWDKRYTKASASPPAAPASEPAPTCSVPCLSRTCPRICELDHGHPPDRDHSHASRPNEAGHTWPASEPAVRPLSVPLPSERLFGIYMRLQADSAERAALIEVQGQVRAIEVELAATARDYQVARDAHDRRHDDYNAARAEVEQLRGKLAEVERVARRLLEEQEGVRNDYAEGRRFSLTVILKTIERLPLDTGTATDASGEVTKWALQVAEAWLHRSWSGADMAGGSIADLAATITDAIKAAVAPHVCKCSNGPCPKCGGTGPEGEWFEGSEVECADCGAPLIVATAEPCHGSSTFEAIDEEPDEEDDESGEDAPGAVGE